MQKKLVISLIMVITMIFSNLSFVAASLIYDPDTGELTEIPGVPLIKALEPSVITQKAGTTQTHEIIIKNVGTGIARNVLITARASAESGATAQFLDRTHSITQISASLTRKTSLEINIPANIKSGTYTLRLDYTYVSSDKKEITSSDEITLRVENEYAEPNLIITDLKTDLNNITADSNFKLTGTIENTSSMEARDVQLVIGGFSTDTLNLLGSSNNMYISSIAGNKTSEVSFDLKTSRDIERGSYPVTFKLTYKDSENNSYTNEYEFYVNVAVDKKPETNEEKAMLQVTNVTVPTEVIQVGEEFEAVISLQNTGDTVAKNVKITSDTGSAAIVPKSANIQQKNSLAVGEAAEFSFRFSPTSESVTQNYTIGFNIDYDNGSDNEDIEQRKEAFAQYIGVNVKNLKKEEEKEREEEEKEREREEREREREEREREREKEEEDENISVPKIIISRYESNPIIVQAGQEFDLSMSFLNTHRDLGVRNIEAVLTVVEESETKGNVFTPVDSSNSFYMDSISPMGEVSKVLRLYTVPDASPKNYQIQVALNYEDEKGNEYTSNKIIGINVKQVMKLETSEIIIQEYGNVGEPVYLSFSIYNTGRVALNNLMIKVEGEFDTSNAEYYIGPFDIGSVDYYEGFFMPQTAGSHDGKLIISYEDDMGEEIIEETPFTINVQEMQMFDEMSMREEAFLEPETPQQSSKTAIFVIGGIIAAGIIAFFVRKVIVKKRREQEFYE